MNATLHKYISAIGFSSPQKPYLFLSKKNQIKSHHDIPDIRAEILRTLQFVADEDPNLSFLPWLNINSGFLKRLWIGFKFRIKKRIAHRSNRGFDLFKPDQFSRWDIMTLYSDLPLASRFDFDRFINSFPADMRAEYQAGKKNDEEPVQLEGTRGGKPGLWDILAATVEFQSRQASELFIQPLAFESNKQGLLEGLYSFSGQLISGLVILTELKNAVTYGMVLNAHYLRKLRLQIDRFIAATESPPTMADLLFFHSALWRMWRLINGQQQCKKDKAELQVIQEPSLLKYRFRDAHTIIQLIKILFLSNPVSVLLNFNIFCDTLWLNQEICSGSDIQEPKAAQTVETPDGATDDEDLDQEKELVKSMSQWELKIGEFFQADIGKEYLFWLANYTYSGLMSPYPDQRIIGEGADILRPPQDIFANRLKYVGRIFDVMTFTFKGQGAARQNIVDFLIFFYGLLLKEFLVDFDRDQFPNHPLPDIDRPQIPHQVRLSYFGIDPNNSDAANKVSLSLSKGEPFPEIARQYARDDFSRLAGGEMGWKKRDDLLDKIESIAFFPMAGSQPLVFDKHHFYLIHERKYSETTLIFERIIQWSLTKEATEMRQACCKLFAPLNTFVKQAIFDRRTDHHVEQLDLLMQQASFYIGLLNLSEDRIKLLK